MEYFRNWTTLFSLARIYAYETFVYTIGCRDMTTYVRNLVNKGSKHNVLLIKIVQSLMGFGAFSPEIVEVLKQNTHSVRVEEDEIDIIQLEKIKKDYNIRLLTEQHFHAGMVAVVYLGVMDNDQKVIIKLRRNNIKERIAYACTHVTFMYNLIRNLVQFSSFAKMVVMSLRSITKTSEYLVSQCDFDKEINYIQTTQREVLNYPAFLQNIRIPKVYNKPDDIPDTNFIVMEYFDGVFSNELTNMNEREQYLGDLITFNLLMGWFFTYHHTDIHCGNVIYMKNGDALTVGIIDFGMVIQFSDSMQEFTRRVGDIFQNRVPRNEAYKIINYLLVDKIRLDELTPEYIDFLNSHINRLIDKIVNGGVDERDLLLFIDDLSKLLQQNLEITLESFVLILSTAMLNSTFRVLAGYDDSVIDRITKRVLNEILE